MISAIGYHKNIIYYFILARINSFNYIKNYYIFNIMSEPFKKEFHEFIIYLRKIFPKSENIVKYHENLHKINTEKISIMYFQYLSKYNKLITSSNPEFFKIQNLFFFNDILSSEKFDDLKEDQQKNIWKYINNLLTFSVKVYQTRNKPNEFKSALANMANNLLGNKNELEPIPEHPVPKPEPKLKKNIELCQFNFSLDKKELYDTMVQRAIKVFVKSYRITNSIDQNSLKREIAGEMANQIWTLIHFEQKNQAVKALFIEKYQGIFLRDLPEKINLNSYLSFKIKLENSDLLPEYETIILEFKLEENID